MTFDLSIERQLALTPELCFRRQVGGRGEPGRGELGMTLESVSGSCHCGAVTFQVALDLSATTLRCNCTICSKTRFWFVPVAEDAFTLCSGESALSRYSFEPRTIIHSFCRHCGVKTHGTGKNEDRSGFVGVSIAALELSPARLARFKITYLDGRHDRFDQTPEVSCYL